MSLQICAHARLACTFTRSGFWNTPSACKSNVLRLARVCSTPRFPRALASCQLPVSVYLVCWRLEASISRGPAGPASTGLVSCSCPNPKEVRKTPTQTSCPMILACGHSRCVCRSEVGVRCGATWPSGLEKHAEVTWCSSGLHNAQAQVGLDCCVVRAYTYVLDRVFCFQ